MIYLHTATASLILFTIALLAGNRKNLSHYILISWLLVLLSNITSFAVLSIYPAPFDLPKQFLLEFSDSSAFMHGPLFWFYTRSLTQPGFRFKQADWLQLLPFIFIVVLKTAVGLHTDNGLMNILQWITLLKFISLLVYTLMVSFLIRTHQQDVQQIFSNLENRQLNWLKFAAIGIIILWVIGFSSIIPGWFNFQHANSYDGISFQVSVDIFIITMTYFGFKQKDVYPEPTKSTHQNKTIEVPFVKYQKSGLDELHSTEIYDGLMRLIQVEEIYKDESLTLYKLAGMLKVSPNHLSQVINSTTGRNFFDFINFYRIECVKKILAFKEKEHLTMLGIAYDCGFNSKAAFHRAFKKFTGVTPTEYKKTTTFNSGSSNIIKR
jgi:AraC-like DNA-binding protein